MGSCTNLYSPCWTELSEHRTEATEQTEWTLNFEREGLDLAYHDLSELEMDTQMPIEKNTETFHRINDCN